MAREELVERLARASFQHWRANCDRLGVHMDKGRTFDDMPDGERDFALSHARACLSSIESSGMVIVPRAMAVDVFTEARETGLISKKELKEVLGPLAGE